MYATIFFFFPHWSFGSELQLLAIERSGFLRPFTNKRKTWADNARQEERTHKLAKGVPDDKLPSSKEADDSNITTAQNRENISLMEKSLNGWMREKKDSQK